MKAIAFCLSVLISALIICPFTAKAESNEKMTVETKKVGVIVAVRKNIFRWNIKPDTLLVPHSEQKLKNFVGYLDMEIVSINIEEKGYKLRHRAVSLRSQSKDVVYDNVVDVISGKATAAMQAGGYTDGNLLTEGLLDKSEVTIELIKPDGTIVTLWHYILEVNVESGVPVKKEIAP